MAKKSVIVNLDVQIKQLIANHQRLTELNRELSSERDKLKVANRTLQEQVKEFQNQISHLQLTESLTGESRDKNKAKARVNRLMREVDKCIELLSKQDGGESAQ